MKTAEKDTLNPSPAVCDMREKTEIILPELGISTPFIDSKQQLHFLHQQQSQHRRLQLAHHFVPLTAKRLSHPH